MNRFKRALFLCIAFLSVPGWKSEAPRWTRNQIRINKSFFSGPLKEGPATVFIHGTKSSTITRALCNLDYPHGINPVNLMRTRSLLRRIAYTLSSAYPHEFPLDSFYFYSWEGQLTFPSRLQAAQKLYPILKNHTGPLTLITHSHGANVALYLARCAELDGNKDFQIERLIILAPPVQEATKQYAQSHYFKKIYNFYSTADIMQVADMQGTYRESYKEAPKGTTIPFFSERTFPCAPHIKQVRILLDGQSPGHLHFLLDRFIKHLPLLIDLADSQKDYEATRNCYIIDIPRGARKPSIVRQVELRKNYIPRSQWDRLRPLSSTLKTD